jgi:signal transduction histidine kinase
VAVVLVAVSAAIAAWLMHRYRFIDRHGSQAVKLLLSFLAVAVPSIILYPSLVDASERARRQLIETRYAPEVINQRQELRLKLQKALAEIDRIVALDDLVRASDPPVAGPPSDGCGLPGVVTDQPRDRAADVERRAAQRIGRDGEPLCDEPARLRATAAVDRAVMRLGHARGGLAALLGGAAPACTPAKRYASRAAGRAGSVVVHSMLDYGNLSFISAQNPYVALVRSQSRPQARPRTDVEFVVYGWSRRVLYSSDEAAPPLPEDAFRRAYESRTPFWATMTRGSNSLDAFLLSDRGAIYVLATERQNGFGHLVAEAELLALAFIVFAAGVLANMIFNLLVGRAPGLGSRAVREVRASFYRKLFLAFVAARHRPGPGTGAGVTRLHVEPDAHRRRKRGNAPRHGGRSSVPGSASVRPVNPPWRMISLCGSAAWSRRTSTSLMVPSCWPRANAICLRQACCPAAHGRGLSQDFPGWTARRMSAVSAPASWKYIIAATPVQLGGREAVLTIPLASRQQETEAQIDELDRRVLLAAVLFIMLGAGIGYYMAERIADPVNRLMRATRRIARGDLDARVLATSSDELRRLVDAFNQMADDLQRQRGELERTNRLAAWADMARQVAHDIKNPLTPIQLNAEHLRRVHFDQGKPLGNVMDECVGNILGQVRLLRQISSEFSSFATSPEPRPVETDLAELVEEVVEPYRAGLAERVQIDTHVAETLPHVSVDRMLVGRALTNIIENALARDARRRNADDRCRACARSHGAAAGDR